MSQYDLKNNWQAKDAINAPVVGAEFQDEFNAIQAAVNSKVDTVNSALTGVPTTSTPDGGTADQVVNVEYTTNGTANIDANTLESRNQVTAKTGSASPNNSTNSAGYVFSGDNDSGLFNNQDGQVSLAVNGVDRVRVESNQSVVINPLVAQSGLVVSTGQVTLQGSGRITGVDTVSSSTDAANKNYVDGRFNTLRSHNAVGSFVFARRTAVQSTVTANQTISGGSLRTTGVPVRISGDGNLSSSGSGAALSGTWRALGSVNDTFTVRYPATLWVRIS